MRAAINLTKAGWIFRPGQQRAWLASHASVPFAMPLHNGKVRVFFSPRDKDNQSSIAWLDFNPDDKEGRLELSDQPLIPPGILGTFNDRGSMMSWAVPQKDEYWFYFIGWNVSTSVPSHPSIGMARVKDALGDKPEMISEPGRGPVLDRCSEIPFFASNPCVIEEQGIFRMWYLHGLGWIQLPNGKLTPSYCIGHACSSDGMHWRVDNSQCLGFVHENEIAIARPAVTKNSDGTYEMWYCFRGVDFPYRLGYAQSVDGITWERMDHLAVIHASTETLESAVDNEMQCYPHMFLYKEKRHLLYCGNDFGNTGFGLAR